MICRESIIKNILRATAFVMIAGNMLGIATYAQAKENTGFLPPDTTDTLKMGSASIIQSHDITRLVHSQIKFNAKQNTVEGFRIQIYSENGDGAKTEAATVQATFKGKHPDIESYYSYKQPTFIVRVGDYKKQIDAKRMLLKLLHDYPTATVVKEHVEP